MPPLPRTASLATLCLSASLCLPSTAQAADDGWDWMVAPYIWGINVNTDLETVSPPSSSSSDREFDDVLDSLDGAFLLHAEGQGDNIGAFADITYVGLADDNDHPRFNIESDLDARLFEIAAVWSPGPQRFQGVEVFAGLRYIDLDFTTRLEPVNPAFGPVTVDAGDSYNDFMIGSRYTWAMSENWSLTLRGDGSFGGSEGTWNASGVLQYRASYGTWLLGYRYLDSELESGNADLHITVHGPQIGYGFRF